MYLRLLIALALLQLAAANQIWRQFLDLGLENIINQKQYNDAPRNNAEYDFIIVGSGPAGCVLANRLSENPNWTVYLIEAGGIETAAHKIPIMSAYLQATHSNWGYKSVPQKGACYGMYNQECSLPRGKVLGGSSSINYMIYNRGNRRDFDRWAGYGNPGWSYKEILPYFLKSENAQLEGLEHSPYHNHSGPLNVEYVGYRSNAANAYVKAAQEAGYKMTDYNGESQSGVSYIQANTLKGRRHSAFSSYIQPIRDKRKNLHIVTLATVTRVLIDPHTKEAYGVRLLYRNSEYTIRARKEVILSAGVFNSPQILMLSGIGPRDNLQAIGVPVLRDLPVGKLMYDHMSHFGPTFTVNTHNQTFFTSLSNFPALTSYIKGDTSSLFASIGGTEALTFVKTPFSREPDDFPDIELITTAGSIASDEGTGILRGANFRQDIYTEVYKPLFDARQDHFSILVMQFHPKSAGSLWLKSRNPLDWPHIDPNYFRNPNDIEDILYGIKEAIRISKMPAMQKLGTRLHTLPVPGCGHLKFGSDNYWRCSIRVMSYTIYHQVATCRMGPPSNPTTVVNHKLQVHGIGRLRVVDTSIIPFPPTSHTNALSFMIGEKAADMIKRRWS